MATSSIRITKICQWCGVEFEAQKVSTKYCSHRYANLAYKQAVRIQVGVKILYRTSDVQRTIMSGFKEAYRLKGN